MTAQSPVIHEEWPVPSPRPIRLKLCYRPAEEGVRLVAVRENGSEIRTIIRFSHPGGAVAWSSVRHLLETEGYDTSWAKWDSKGRIILEGYE